MKKRNKELYYYIVWQALGAAQGSFVAAFESYLDLTKLQSSARERNPNALVTGFFPITKKTYETYEAP